MQKPTHRNFKRRPKRYAHPVDAKVGDRFPLSIKKLGVEGQGIGYFKHKVCFVPGALPGEVVVAEVTVVHDNYLEAKLHQLRQPSPDRVTPKDAYAGLAGGFELETLAYDKQLAFKKQVVLEALAKFKPLGYRHYWVKDTLAAPHPYGYRNKAQFQVRMQDGHVVAGLYQADSHTVVDMQTCAVQMPGTMKVINTLVKLIEELAIPVYNEANQSGIIKTLAVRESLATGQIQVAIITNTAKLIKNTPSWWRLKTNSPKSPRWSKTSTPATPPGLGRRDHPLVRARLHHREPDGAGLPPVGTVIFAAQPGTNRGSIRRSG